MLWPYMNDDPFAKNPSGKLSIKMQLKPATNGLNLQIMKPFQTTKFENMPLPFNVLYEPGLLTMRKSLHKKLIDSMYGVDKSVCLIDRKVVKTFDNVTLERQPSDCWTLMAADSSLTRKMAILEKMVNQQSAVLIKVDNTVIEIDSSNLQAIKVARQTKQVSSAEPVLVRDTYSGKVVARIQMLADDTMKVELPEHYVELLVTREGVQVHACLLAHRGRMRGVCGDLDGEQKYDLTGPFGCVYHSGKEFYNAYRAPVNDLPQCTPRRPLYCIRRPSQLRQSQQYYENVQGY